jgi:arylsulfatase A-like enzyme
VLRVPLIVHFPGDQYAGVRVPALAESLDVAPTVLSAVGLRAPSDYQGKDLRPLASGSEAAIHEYSVAFTLHSSFQLTSIVKDDWKLIEATGTRQSQLYDLNNDPHELTNLLEIEPARVDSLTRDLAEWRSATPIRVHDNNRQVSKKVMDVLRKAGYLKQGETVPTALDEGNSKELE